MMNLQSNKIGMEKVAQRKHQVTILDLDRDHDGPMGLY